jgi:hypothetical protein
VNKYQAYDLYHNRTEWEENRLLVVSGGHDTEYTYNTNVSPVNTQERIVVMECDKAIKDMMGDGSHLPWGWEGNK